MSTEIPVGFTEEFSANVELLLQQKPSRFRSAVRSFSYTGKSAQVVQQTGPIELVDLTTRHADTPIINTPHDNRWMFPAAKGGAQLIDWVDNYQTIADFQSSYVQNGAAAANRAIDRAIINAFFSETTKTGEDHGTTTDWASFVSANAAHQIAAGAAGLTIAKLRAAKQALMAAEVDVDSEMLFCALSASAHDDLLGQTQAVSLDYTDRAVLVDGRIRSFMGFNFIQSELLGLTGAERRLPVWAQSGMAVGVWGDVKNSVTIRNDKNDATQIYTSVMVGATRVEEKKIVEILVTE